MVNASRRVSFLVPRNSRQTSALSLLDPRTTQSPCDGGETQLSYRRDVTADSKTTRHPPSSKCCQCRDRVGVPFSVFESPVLSRSTVFNNRTSFLNSLPQCVTMFTGRNSLSNSTVFLTTVWSRRVGSLFVFR